MSRFPADPSPSDPKYPSSTDASSSEADLDEQFREMEAELETPANPSRYSQTSRRPLPSVATDGTGKAALPTLVLVETAFLASTASLLWLSSYYLSLVPWMRILFPLPIALVYLRWGNRASWMSCLVTGLLLSVLMGPYLSMLFIVPYGLLGVQLGALWYRRVGWGVSIPLGMLLSTLGFFFRVWVLSVFLGEDLWVYLTARISDFLEWVLSMLVGWGILGVGALGQVNVTVVQIFAVGMVLFSDLVYLFTIHLAAWLLLDRLGNPIPDPPRWVQVLLEEEV